jgi:hypothetical protein
MSGWGMQRRCGIGNGAQDCIRNDSIKRISFVEQDMLLSDVFAVPVARWIAEHLRVVFA